MIFVTETNTFTFYSQKILQFLLRYFLYHISSQIPGFLENQKIFNTGQLQNAHRMKQLTEKTLTLYMEMQKLEVHFYLLLKTFG